MTALRDKMIILAPEFATEDVDEVARQEQFIVWAALQVNRRVYGNEDKADLATILLSAHLLKKMPSASSSDPASKGVGPITSDKVGDLQINYGSVGADVRADLATTNYGLQYWAIKRQVPKTPLCI